jgi:hypothetical protein
MMTMTMTSDVASKPFTWSYSALKNFDTCARRYYEYNIAKSIDEPESVHLREGHRVHSAFAARIKDAAPLPLGLTMHEGMLARLVDAPGEIYVEQRLGLTSSFQPAEFFGKNVWFRTVLDVVKIKPDGRALILDWKTGKVADDMTQLALSAVTLFAHDARVHEVKAALIFTAYGEHVEESYSRSDVTSIWSRMLPKVNRLLDAHQTQHYPPNPGGLCRRWCAVTSCPFHGR